MNKTMETPGSVSGLTGAIIGSVVALVNNWTGITANIFIQINIREAAWQAFIVGAAGALGGWVIKQIVAWCRLKIKMWRKIS